MKKRMMSLILALGVLACAQVIPAKQYANWSEIVDEMIVVLNDSYTIYQAKDVEKGKERVNDAYFGYYEKLGVERAVLSYVSGKRAAAVEYQFATVKRLMTEQKPDSEIRAGLDRLITMLREDGNALDGKEESGFTTFIASLLILLREGFEAILIVAAIAAYLIRSGNAGMTRVVYLSAASAVIASAAMAVALQRLFTVSGANQELLEGLTMLLAVVVLFFVSCWMISKAQSEAWNAYIEKRVASAVTTGSSFALGAAAFLAVFREGAETILFYQALMAEAGAYMDMLWYGFAVACLCLVVIFIIIRYGSLRLPLRPFFIATSILMYIMAISFAGGGVKELQEADFIAVTPVAGIDSIDILGIYPTMETLVPQAVMLVLAVFSFLYYTRKSAASAAKI
jgi:high-affinity iron transporter